MSSTIRAGLRDHLVGEGLDLLVREAPVARPDRCDGLPEDRLPDGVVDEAGKSPLLSTGPGEMAAETAVGFIGDDETPSGHLLPWLACL